MSAVPLPCGVCRRVHRGRCTPADARSVQVVITLPGRVARRLFAHVPWGTRSRWVARLVERELDTLQAASQCAR